MESGPTTSWQRDGETMETVTDFTLGGSKITADGDCNHEIKRRLFLRRKAMTNLDSILKSRDITLPTKVWMIKAMVFPVVMYGCESWSIKKTEHQRIDTFVCVCVIFFLFWQKRWVINFQILLEGTTWVSPWSEAPNSHINQRISAGFFFFVLG